MSIDAAARDLGLKIGMGVAHARALQANLVVADTDRSADAAVLAGLAAWAMRYTPLVALDPPDGLWLDVSGCVHLFGGEGRLLARLVTRMGAMGFVARAAIADTPGVAHAVARFAGGGVVPQGAGAETIDDLPIAALRLPPDISSALQVLGFMRVRQIAGTPRGPLTRRFGPLPLLRLDQALDVIGEPLSPIEPPPMPRCQHVLAEPISTAESLAQVARDLADDLCGVLELTGQGARRIDLLFHRLDGQRLAVRIGTVRPTRDAAHLARLLIERLDTVEPGLGIEAMEIAAPQVETLPAEQTTTVTGRRAADLPAIVDRLGNRLGAHRLWRAIPVASRSNERTNMRIQPLASTAGLSWPTDLPRPARLIVPEQIDVIAQVPDYPPAYFRWRGRRYRVHRGDGPERVFNEWWRDGPLFGVRDYFRIEVDDGARYWVFRAFDEESEAAALPKWFLHGAFA